MADEPETRHCLNCDATLTGQYCGDCGQRAQSRLISVVELVKDAFGDLFELDSRLWRTLIPLAVRPGELTRDYLRGRRARYMPPFRMYLVLSLAFFVIAFFDPYRDFGLLLAPVDDEPVAAAPAEVDDDSDGPRIVFDLDGNASNLDDCSDVDDYDPSELPGWLARRLTRERVRAACENIMAGDGAGVEAVFDRMVENIPAGLFFLLPVMALVLKLLYPLSRRYYVEHLLFVIHFHAFVFLVLTVEILFSRLVELIGVLTFLEDLSGLAAMIYIPVYLYRGQRRVYGQNHWATAVKFCVLCAAYLVGLGTIVAVAGLVAAFAPG